MSKISSNWTNLIQLCCALPNGADFVKTQQAEGSLTQKNICQWIQSQSNLKILNLSRRGLTEVPEELFLLKEVEWLDLSYNQLTSLPPIEYEMKTLQHLIVTGNSLELSFKRLSSLKDRIPSFFL